MDKGGIAIGPDISDFLEKNDIIELTQANILNE